MLDPYHPALACGCIGKNRSRLLFKKGGTDGDLREVPTVRDHRLIRHCRKHEGSGRPSLYPSIGGTMNSQLPLRLDHINDYSYLVNAYVNGHIIGITNHQ